MKSIRIYHPAKIQVSDNLTLTPEASLHVGIVLRRQPGEHLTLFCGDNKEYLANILQVDRKKVVVEVLSETMVNRESPRIIHLVQAISKGDRMETVVQKAVELGVNSITPLLSARCVVKLNEERLDKKVAQWQAIAIAACEQCGRNQVPIVNVPVSLTTYLSQKSDFMHFVLHPNTETSWREYKPSEEPIGLLIGPEGGFTEDEIQLMLAKQCLPLRLGPRILRTETAAIAAMTLLQTVFGDL